MLMTLSCLIQSLMSFYFTSLWLTADNAQFSKHNTKISKFQNSLVLRIAIITFSLTMTVMDKKVTLPTQTYKPFLYVMGEADYSTWL